MNNVRKLSILLLLSAGVLSTVVSADSCSSDCGITVKSATGSTATTGSSCGSSCSTDCNSSNNSCNTSCNTDCSSTGSSNSCCTTTFRARPVVGNLTYRNDLTFYNRYHDERCNFFVWDNTFIYEKNRHSKCAASGIFGTPNGSIVVAEQGGDVNSLFLGLGSDSEAGYSSTVSIHPRRRVFSWLSQMIFNLDSCCTGLWADFSFAVTNARHKLCLKEVDTVSNDIPGGPANVVAAFQDLGVLPRHCKRTGVDDALLRLGYDWNYCGNDHVGFYGLGYIPTGKRRCDAQLFSPTVGSKGGGVGFGFTADYTAYSDECNNSDLTLMTEFKYTYMLRHKETRVFDLTNGGPLSRFFLVAPETNPFAPQPILPFLTQNVKVEMRSTIDWWLGLHYQYCNWGVEFDYNLYWRDREKICGANFNFGDFGIFDLNGCSHLTSSSTATIGGAVGSATSDATFTPLTAADVNLGSAVACKALINTLSGALSYNNVWCDCYPWYLGIGGNVEFASKKQRRSNFENWGIFGKAAISF